MIVEVRVPQAGESVTEGMIHKWHKNDGDVVGPDDILVELETDKATLEVPAGAAGAVKRLVAQGATVKVGQVIATIDSEKAAGTKKSAAAEPAAPAAPKAGRFPTVEAAEARPPATAAARLPSSDAVAAASGPAARRVAAEAGLDLAVVPGSGKDGRVTKGDVITHLATASGGSSGRSTAVAAGSSSPAAATGTRALSSVAAVPTGNAAGERREPMSMIRRRIAERLVAAQQTAAILTTFNEVDMQPIMALRTKYKDKFKDRHGVGLGFMSFFVRAAVEALRAFPAINGWVDGNDIIYHDYYNIGIAVSSPRGLVVPVLRHCENLGFADIEKTIGHFSELAKANKVSMDDMSGGTFTVSNGGVFGSLLSTPILNPPQSAILGMHKIEERPVVVDGQIVIRPMMYLALSYDHRIVDGKESVQFLVRIKEQLEDPSRMLLEV